jgi:hypothetical protein
MHKVSVDGACGGARRLQWPRAMPKAVKRLGDRQEIEMSLKVDTTEFSPPSITQEPPFRPGFLIARKDLLIQ